jgi:histidyl-tRNA synthetase
MSEKIVAVKGMNDIVAPASAHWEWLEARVRELFARYGYRNIRTPIVEPLALFVRGLGEVTDIVEKEMYAFEDRLNGEQLALRPEGTAGVVRAAVEHALLYDGPKRYYYMGPMFRHERPQRGRYRQFHQIGVEALGLAGPEADAELITLAADLWRELGLNDVALELNTLGQPAERQAHRQALIAYFEQHHDALDEDGRRRLYSNPLRILDTKNPALQALVEAAPRLLDYLGEASRAHFETVCRLLDAQGIAYRVNPRLVRGLDYYHHTVFEFVTTSLGAQGTVLAGGRYDGLMAQLGGKAAPGVGWAMGVERVLELLKAQQRLPEPPVPDVYAIVPDAQAWPVVLTLLRALRAAGVHVLMHASGPEGLASMKAQFKKADASGARYALIFGAEELAARAVAVKPLRAQVGPISTQTTLPIDEVAQWATQLRARP